MTIGRALPRFEKKVGLTLTVLTLFGLTASAATFAAFSDTTANSGNTFQAGTVDIDDDDAGAALYDLYDGTPLAKPGDADSGCINVTYKGSLDAGVVLYSGSTLNANALDDELDLVIKSHTTGSVTADCTNWTDVGAATEYTGTLADFVTTYAAHGSGLAMNVDGNGGSDAIWSANDTRVFKFEVTLTADAAVDNDANANGAPGGTETAAPPAGFSTGSHQFVWEARNT